jgi:hypothetical protein
MKPLTLPVVGSAVRMTTVGGQELGVVMAVNRERRLIVARMEDGRVVEMRVPPHVPLESDLAKSLGPAEAN